MNNRNKIRKDVRIKIYDTYHELFESILLIDKNKRYGSLVGDKIIYLFRTKIGYSKKTVDADILCTAVMGYKKYNELKMKYEKN